MKELFTQLAISIDAKANNLPHFSVEEVIVGVLNTVYWAAGLMAVAMIIFGGFRYIVSDGNADKITKSKDIILYSVIGLGVVIGAFIITKFIVGWF